MGRIANTFQQLKSRGEKALIPYLMAGDPNPQQAPAYFEALLHGGADLLEVGVPFSDPVADGPTIQAAGLRAQRAHTSLDTVFQLVGGLRPKTQAPLLLMTYYNPVFVYGEERFLQRCQSAGVDGLIVPDLPLEEAAPLSEGAQEKNIDVVHIATPETAPQRLERMAETTTGFLYVVARHGVTGQRQNAQNDTPALIRTVRQTVGDTPLAVGFGLTNADEVRAVLEAGADGAVVGSALVAEVERGILPQLLQEKVRLLKAATRLAATAQTPQMPSPSPSSPAPSPSPSPPQPPNPQQP